MPNFQVLAGVVFTAILVVFFIVAYFVPPRSPQANQILRVLASICAGAAGAFLTGGIALQITGQLSPQASWTLSATGGIALFVLGWLTWKEVTNTPGFNIAVPAGTTFRGASQLIGTSSGKLVRLQNFTPQEQEAVLTTTDLRAASPKDALRQLMNMVPINTIRPYAVDERSSEYVLIVNG